MNVLIISKGLPSERDPLLGIFEFDQAKALAQAGIQVTYFAIDLRSIRRKRKLGISSGIKENITWHRINLPVGAVRKSVLARIGAWALRRLFHRVFINGKPDLIHAHFTGSAYMAAKLAEEEHIPLVITEHSSLLNKASFDPEMLEIAKYAYTRADAVIAVGKSLAEHIKEQTGVSCVVIPNIMAADAFNKICRDATEHGFGFVFCGNLIQRKRPLLLLEAFRKVLENNPDSRLGIIGDGPLRAELEGKVAALGLNEQVRLYGKLNRDQIADVYRHYDCLVLPSENETFGVVLIEAMAAGLPIIATSCGGPDDIVMPETGLLIPVDDQTALVNAMEKMLRQQADYDPKKIRKYVQDHFSAQTVAEQIRQVYVHVLGREQ